MHAFTHTARSVNCLGYQGYDANGAHRCAGSCPNVGVEPVYLFRLNVGDMKTLQIDHENDNHRVKYMYKH